MAILTDYRSRILQELKSATFWRDIIAEGVATFVLVATQCALPLSWNKDGMGSAPQIGIGMGFVVTCMIEAYGMFGGAHMNPAVTISMAFTAKITIIRALFYILIQCCGGIAGAALVAGLTPNTFHESLSATTLGPEVTIVQGVFMEMFITFILVSTIYGATNTDGEKVVYQPSLPIGMAVGIGIMLAINHTGGSMNPARSLGPAVVMNIWKNHWVYWVGPIAGGLLAGIVHYYIFGKIERRRQDEVDISTDITMVNGFHKYDVTKF